MNERAGIRYPQFYITTAQPCPYLPGRYEKKVFTHLLGEDPVALNDLLTEAGFRRSQNIAYRPACDGCDACVSVRVIVDEFAPSRNFRKLLNRNADITATPRPPRATQEQFALLRTYLDARHPDGGMADMTAMDYTSMIEDTTIETDVIEYRVAGPETPANETPAAGPDGKPPLIAAALTDRLHDGLSMVYSFYSPAATTRSLGSWMVLEHIERARQMGLPYVYLGYWIADCRKMAYKTRFQPLEALTRDGWRRYEDAF